MRETELTIVYQRTQKICVFCTRICCVMSLTSHGPFN